MVDAEFGAFEQNVFAVIGDAGTGIFDHREVVSAIADGEGGAALHAALGGDFMQGGAFGVSIKDRFLGEAGEARAVIEQDIGAVQVKAKLGGGAGGEVGEAAGNQRGESAVGAHGGDQFARAGRKFGAPPGAFEGGDVETLEQGDAFAQALGEIDTARHGAGGDGGDLRAKPGFGGEIIEGFGGDDGAVHIRDQDGFAAAPGFDGEKIDRLMIESGEHGGGVGFDHAGDFGGLAGREPHRRAAGDDIAHAGDHGIGEGNLVSCGNQDQ